MAGCRPYRRPTRGAAAVALAACLVSAALIPPAAAQGTTPQPILAFNGTDGANPEDSLVTDATGALYGTATSGGPSGGGVVFKLLPPTKTKPTWTELVLHHFGGASDGYDPLGPVTLRGGAIYGMTFLGGSGANGCYADGLGCGTVFSLTPKAGAGSPLVYRVLHRFSPVQSANDGAMPEGGVILDSAGNIYGTTGQGGGTSCSAPGTGCGVFFRITPGGSYNILYRFKGGADANNPGFSLSLGPDGGFYGASQFGGDTGAACVWGSLGCGTVFRLTPNATNTAWSEAVLYRFTGGADGSNPGAGVTVDTDGTIYGTTSFGGASKQGVVFRLRPPATGSGPWTEDVLHPFTGGSDGAAPQAPLTIGAPGQILGATAAGGNSDCVSGSGCGILFELTPSATGAAPWNETVLYRFTGGTDGGEIASGLLLSTKYDIFGGRHSTAFGTSLVGGVSGDGGGTGRGSVFSLTLTNH